jgi:hypothetical protein
MRTSQAAGHRATSRRHQSPGSGGSWVAQEEAIETARAKRPILLTAFGSLAPPVTYGFIVAVLWAIRGFRPDLKRRQEEISN